MATTSIAMACNSGNGVISAVSADGGAALGVYSVIMRGPARVACPFKVIDPSGAFVGAGNVGTAYDGVINFLVSEGSMQHEGGDGYLVTVT